MDKVGKVGKKLEDWKTLFGSIEKWYWVC